MAKAEIIVHGRNYSVACTPGQERRLAELAKQLDQRVRRIATAVGDVGDDRLFLVAALSLLDELDTVQREGTQPTADIEARVAEILDAAAARIESVAARADTRRRSGPKPV